MLKLLFLFLIFYLPSLISSLKVVLNPDCSEYPICSSNSSIISLFDVSSGSSNSNSTENEESRWMWSVLGHPTLESALTPRNVTLNADWITLLNDSASINDSLYYSQKPFYSSSLMLSQLIEFNDTEDSGIFKTKFPFVTYEMRDFSWKRNVLKNDSDIIAVQFIGSNFTGHGFNKITDGVINLTLSAYGDSGYGFWLPHLSHSPKTSEVDVQLMNLQSNSGFKGKRFALKLAVVSTSAEKNATLYRAKSTTLDDEHTPGIFSTEEIIIPGINDTFQSYIQWRPIVYTKPSRDLSDSTNLNVGDPKQVSNPSGAFSKTLLYAIYGNSLDYILVNNITVSIGNKGDGFYTKTNYSAWTFTFGTGEPIENGFSWVITLVMAIMTITTLVVCIIAGVMCMWKKWTLVRDANPVSYETI